MNKEILKKIIFDQNEVIKKIEILDRKINFEKNANYVLLGIRRSGKSTLLCKRAKDLVNSGISYSQIIYINFDDERLIGFSASDFDDILLTANEISDKEHYFFFDEIQNIDGWEKFARRLADQKYNVWITGSNAKMLSKEMGEALGGRYLSKTIFPFTFKEYLSYLKVDINNLSSKNVGYINSILSTYFKYGGFPECINIVNKKEYISNVYQKVLLNDIVLHNSIRNINGIKLLIKKVADVVGSDISYTKLQNLITGIGYKISKDIVIDYIEYTKNAFLLFDIKNYYASFLDKESNSKYYFMDNGLLSLFVDDKDSELLENLVAISLYQKDKDNLYYLKSTKTGVDIDFYLSSTNEAYQVCYSLNNSSYEREINGLVKFAKSSKEGCSLNIITYEENKTLEVEGYKIKVISLKEFLL